MAPRRSLCRPMASGRRRATGRQVRTARRRRRRVPMGARWRRQCLRERSPPEVAWPTTGGPSRRRRGRGVLGGHMTAVPPRAVPRRRRDAPSPRLSSGAPAAEGPPGTAATRREGAPATENGAVVRNFVEQKEERERRERRERDRETDRDTETQTERERDLISSVPEESVSYPTYNTTL